MAANPGFSGQRLRRLWKRARFAHNRSGWQWCLAKAAAAAEPPVGRLMV